jgi:replicative DNA helicase
MLLSQISNEGAKFATEGVMSFKGSGALGAAADLAIEISAGEDDKKEWRLKLYRGEPVLMKWAIQKNRHGRVGTIMMNFLGKTGKFET